MVAANPENIYTESIGRGILLTGSFRSGDRHLKFLFPRVIFKCPLYKESALPSPFRRTCGNRKNGGAVRLFLKYAEAPCTVLVVKDRLLGHNPLAAIYTIDGYYRSLKVPVRQE